MILWGNIEAALVAWLSDRTGIPVRIADQRAPAPYHPYATIRVDGPTPVGMDEVRASTDLGRPAGEEVELTSYGQRTISVSVNVYAVQRGGEYDHTKSARHLAEVAQGSLRLASVCRTLREAGLSVMEIGGVQNLNFVRDAEQVERMQFDVRMALVSTVAERTGYIDTVGIEPAIGGA